MKKIILITLTLVGYNLIAQDNDTIVTDRPTQSASSAVVPKGNLLIEYGFIYEETKPIVDVTYANFLFRYGLFNGVEFRITQNYFGANVEIVDDKGFSPTTLGTKVHIMKEQGAVPQTSIIAQVMLDNGKESFRPGEAIPEIRLNFSNTLSDYVSLGYNIGFAFPEDNTTTIYTAVLGYSFLPGWTAFAEPYGFIFDGGSDHRFNTGLIYLVKNNFQVDLTGGVGLSDISPDYFIGFGAAVGF